MRASVRRCAEDSARTWCIICACAPKQLRRFGRGVLGGRPASFCPASRSSWPGQLGKERPFAAPLAGLLRQSQSTEVTILGSPRLDTPGPHFSVPTCASYWAVWSSRCCDLAFSGACRYSCSTRYHPHLHFRQCCKPKKKNAVSKSLLINVNFLGCIFCLSSSIAKLKEARPRGDNS